MQIPQLHPAVLHGSDKVLTPHRLRTLGGLARITEQPKRKSQTASVDHCPFCLDSPMDSLTHAALHECRMDGWQEHCKWAAEAIAVIRERFLVSTMTALLRVELHCPLSFSAPTKKESVHRRGRKRAVRRESTADSLSRSSNGPKGTVDTGCSHARGHQMVCDTSVRHPAETSYDQLLQVGKQSIPGYGSTLPLGKCY
jgi:hypothetical protein